MTTDSRFSPDASASMAAPLLPARPARPARAVDAPDEWTGVLADGLMPIEPPVADGATLKERLLHRIASSRRGMDGVRTVRERDGHWLPFKDGVSYKLLSLDEPARVRSALVRFEPGASLPAHRHSHHEECMVLSGGLRMGDLVLGRHDYHVAPSGSRHAGLCAPDGATIYLRGSAIGSGRDAVREVIGAWLPGGRDRPLTVHGGQAQGWTQHAAGVSSRCLFSPTGASTASRLVRIAPGVQWHENLSLAADEECLMIDGEAYFDDILLRAGEYWAARQGASRRHVETEPGALFFVHGAPPA